MPSWERACYSPYNINSLHLASPSRGYVKLSNVTFLFNSRGKMFFFSPVTSPLSTEDGLRSWILQFVWESSLSCGEKTFRIGCVLFVFNRSVQYLIHQIPVITGHFKDQVNLWNELWIRGWIFEFYLHFSYYFSLGKLPPLFGLISGPITECVGHHVI